MSSLVIKFGAPYPPLQGSLVTQTLKNLLVMQVRGFNPWIGKMPCRRAWQPNPIFLPGESHGQRSLVGYSPWSLKEPDTTERLSTHTLLFGLPRCQGGKESACQYRRRRFDPLVGKIPWRRKWQPSPVFLPGKSHGQRSLAGYSSWGCKELSMPE